MNYDNIPFIPYGDARNWMRTGDTLAWSGDLRWNPLEAFGLVSKAIQVVAPGKGLAKKLKLNHISSVVWFDKYGIDRLIQLEAVAKGYIPTPVSEMIAKHHGRVYFLPILDELHTEEFERAIMRWLWDKAWRKYDYKSIWKQLASRVSLDARQLFCSEGDFGSKKEGANFKCLKDITLAPRPCDTPDLPCYKMIVRIK